MTKKDHQSDLHQQSNSQSNNSETSSQSDQPKSHTSETGVDQELADLQQQLQQAQQLQQEATNQSQRALADYANLKKRFDKERLEIGSYVTESVVSQLLPSIDNLDRAVQYASEEDQKSPLFQGLAMTMTQMHQAFADLGVSKIEAEQGHDFDPHLHEAVDSVAGDQGKIINQIQPGYQINSRVIRPAQVTVGNGQKTH